MRRKCGVLERDGQHCGPACVEHLFPECLAIARQGLRYYHTYHRASLCVAVLAGLFVWDAFLLRQLTPHVPNSLNSPSPSARFALLPVLVALVVIALSTAQSVPLRHIFYFVFPLVVLFMCGAPTRLWSGRVSRASSVQAAVRVGWLALLVASFWQRWVLSISWGALASTSRGSNLGRWWICACASMGVCLWLPVDFGPWPLMVFGTVAVYWAGEKWIQMSLVDERAGRQLLHCQSTVVVLCGLLAGVIDICLQREWRTSAVPFVLSWGLLLCSLTLPMVQRVRFKHEATAVVSLFTALAGGHLLLSIAYEGIFMLALCSTLLIWRGMEVEICAPQPLKSVKIVDLALLSIQFYLTAFFGTGNIASISSFNLQSTYRFVTTFSPHVMGVLLLVKQLLPMLSVGIAVASVARHVRCSRLRLFAATSLCLDAMTVVFTVSIRDEGSWRDIGESISHFVIVIAFGVFAAAVQGLAAVLLSRLRQNPSGFLPVT